MAENTNRIIKFRKELHKYPEVSGDEHKTATRIKKYIGALNPTKIIENIGGQGLAFVFDSQKPGPNVMFRSELDALPIAEVNQFEYRSKWDGVSHMCGHDGHMAILTELAHLIAASPPTHGKTTLLFQPAEETGQGAKLVIEDPKFVDIKPDYIFALHNLPAYKKHKVVIKDGVFASASTGLIIRLYGIISHAAEPEKGNNPAYAMAAIIKTVEKISILRSNAQSLIIVTPIHARLGERAFGTSPGFAELMFTVRANTNKDFELIKGKIVNKAKENADLYGLKVEFEWVEEFPVTQNHKQCNQFIIDATHKLNLDSEILNEPFRWSEDFGHFLNNYQGALFGLGSGIDTPSLHNPDYDFPDEIIKTGAQIFSNIYKQLLK